jgi:hypothetical protein
VGCALACNAHSLVTYVIHVCVHASSIHSYHTLKSLVLPFEDPACLAFVPTLVVALLVLAARIHIACNVAVRSWEPAPDALLMYALASLCSFMRLYSVTENEKIGSTYAVALVEEIVTDLAVVLRSLDRLDLGRLILGQGCGNADGCHCGDEEGDEFHVVDDEDYVLDS